MFVEVFHCWSSVQLARAHARQVVSEIVTNTKKNTHFIPEKTTNTYINYHFM